MDQGMARLATNEQTSAEAAPGKAATATRGGGRTASWRSCIVTREVHAPDELIRFVLSPDGVVTPDIRRSLPGRGVWVTATRAKVAEAVRRKVFTRAFRRPAQATIDLAEDIARLLRIDASQALSLANKAGAITAGFEKVRAALTAGRVRALIEARDASPEIRAKLVGLHRASGANCAAETIDEFVSSELDMVLGRTNVIHAALLEAPVTGFVLARVLRFRRFELIEKQVSETPNIAGRPTMQPPYRA
jgi:uncharacterized protein